MELIQNLFKYFNNGSTEEQFIETDCKNILFITPTVTGENFYRIIMPFSYISQYVKTIQTAMTGIENHNSTQLYEKRVTYGIKEDHIKWADVIVFPFTTQALKPLYDDIRQIKREQNTEAKIFYNFDLNVFYLPDFHPMKEYMTQEKLDGIDENILFSDCTLMSNPEAQKYFLENHYNHPKYEGRLAERNPPTIIVFPYLAQYPAMFEDKQPQVNTSGKLRLAIPVNDTQYDELRSFAPQLKEINKHLSGVAEIMIVGGRKTDLEFADAMKDIEYMHIPAHPEVEMLYDEILNSKADVFLYLTSDSFFNKTSDDPKRIIDYGMVGVPCIIPSYSPIADIVKAMGWVMESNDLLPAIIEQVANHKPTLHEHAVVTFNKITQIFSYGNPAAMQNMAAIFEQ